MRHLAMAAALAALPVTGAAETLFSGTGASASDVLGARVRVLDGRAAQQYAGSTRLRPASTRTVAVAVAEASHLRSYRGPYLTLARDAARRHGIPEDLFARLVQQESGWNPAAVSHKGALGLAQLMPGTAALLGVDPADPKQNLDGGARYLRRQFERFGDWRLALAAYNAGPEAVARHGGVPPYAETKGYVVAIMGS